MPEWTAFFDMLSTKVDDETSSHEPYMQKLAGQLGGELQMPVERVENVPLYDHDFVAPLIIKGTDIPTAAIRNLLLEKRTDERCRQYLLGGRKRRPSGRKNTNNDDGDDLDEPHPSKKPRIQAVEKAKKPRSKKRAESDVEEDSDDSSDGGSNVSDADFDLSQYLYLKGATHYDSQDKAVYKCADVIAEDFDDGKGPVVVVYRCKFDAVTRKWGKVDKEEPIHVGDVVKYHQNKRNIATMSKILESRASGNTQNTQGK